MPDPAARWLPPGFPVPARETIEALRRSVVQETRTPHPPDAAELAAAIAADEAGVDLKDLDVRELWTLPREQREPFFAALKKLLAELGAGP